MYSDLFDRGPANGYFFTFKICEAGDPESTDWGYYEEKLELKFFNERLARPEAGPFFGCILSGSYAQFYKEVACDEYSHFHCICKCELEGRLTLHVVKDRWLIDLWGFDRVIHEICAIR
ncbi:hypothetical protein BO86DRAFT_382151 [Aspergillus japonicus CBS 114.51]|uniref:Uncharacterized protein n=1 Tax=Aspergillus japonicus CBS 114.51 TaxID=1448312 RepID=A0A8T8WRS8_ASPJA|nr:hypothetical protein BO86DRAFT_382151 [Aspergillus japonicus CBS 114.51]RAH78374.1 hypothetical protein BO86DRAFT_382151 [Aspergillus japonicus CBS 114.51]